VNAAMISGARVRDITIHSMRSSPRDPGTRKPRRPKRPLSSTSATRSRLTATPLAATRSGRSSNARTTWSIDASGTIATMSRVRQWIRSDSSAPAMAQSACTRGQRPPVEPLVKK
jgi:hypothetical protein